MKLFLICGLGMLLGCGEAQPQPEPLQLAREFYDWTCHDYENLSEIIVSTNTCEDYETGLYWIVAELSMVAGDTYKRKLDKAENWNAECLYQTKLPLNDDYCIEVEGVMLTAYIEPATYSGSLFSD